MIPPTQTLELVLTRERRRAVDFLVLIKLRVVLMVLVTTLVGFYLASSGGLDYLRLLSTLLGTALAAAGTMALNQVVEREVDARMERTRSRPLPEGRLSPAEALVFAGTITVAGLVCMLVAVGPLAGLVTAATVGLYLFAYTPLKLRSSLCMVVGAIPGALPPVIGWVAVRGELGVGAGVLFAILFLWQLPHTLAIARLHQHDYARGGIRVLPVVDPDGTSTERQIVAGCLALLTVGLLPTLIGLAGPVYFVGAFVLGLGFLGCGVFQAFTRSASAARRLLFASLLYLPTVLLLMALDKVGA
ncbi:MAG: heme o synthase [Candidatus Methylomirabilia bacterium]